jgi:tRNA 2-thiouridine synthesizing protein E
MTAVTSAGTTAGWSAVFRQRAVPVAATNRAASTNLLLSSLRCGCTGPDKPADLCNGHIGFGMGCVNAVTCSHHELELKSDIAMSNLTPPLDKDGFLKNHLDWTPDIANQLATAESIQLTEAHWEVMQALRDFYQEFDLSPAMRPLTKYLKQRLGPDKASSIYLLRLFPGSPAKIAAKLAGLPRPENCL